MCCIDQATRWSSTYLMITNFLALWEPIKSTILNSKSKAMNQGVMLTDRELEYLRHCQEVLSIFVYGTTKLQAEKYPTLYYLIPIIYNIYAKLDILRAKLQVSNLYS